MTRRKERTGNKDILTKTPVPQNKEQILAQENIGGERTKYSRIILAILLLAAGGGMATFFLKNGDGKKNVDDGKTKNVRTVEKDAFAKAWEQIAAREMRENPLTPAEMEEVFNELERLGLGKVYWKEPEGKRDTTRPPSLAIGYMHGDSNNKEMSGTSVTAMRSTVIAAKHLRTAGFRTLGIEGIPHGSPIGKDAENLEVKDDEPGWKTIDRKIGLQPHVMVNLLRQRVDTNHILASALPPGTFVGVEPPGAVETMRASLPARSKLDASVHNFLTKVERTQKGDTFYVQMFNNPNGTLKEVIVDGEVFDPAKLRAELKLWQAMQRDDNSGPEAQKRNKAFSQAERPIIVGTGHLHAVQAEAVKDGRKAGFFVPHGADFFADAEKDHRMVTITALLNAMDQKETAGKKK